jgi:hypothetical protein
MQLKIPIAIFCLSSVIAIAVTSSGESPKNNPGVVDIQSTILKASYFAAAKP